MPSAEASPKYACQVTTQVHPEAMLTSMTLITSSGFLMSSFGQGPTVSLMSRGRDSCSCWSGNPWKPSWAKWQLLTLAAH